MSCILFAKSGDPHIPGWEKSNLPLCLHVNGEKISVGDTNFAFQLTFEKGFYYVLIKCTIFLLHLLVMDSNG